MKPLFLCLTLLVFGTRKLAMSATSDDIHQWVDAHNFYRQQVAKGEVYGQPSASKMNAVVWDNELEAKAQAYADRHSQIHNPDKNVPSGRFETGENLFKVETNDPNYKISPYNAVESWFSEHVNYTYAPLRDSDFDPSRGYAIGHYTQLVWSDSLYVGCGVSEIIDGEWNQYYVVCNYGPPGNYIGETPYNRGGPVSNLNCGCGKKCNYCDNIYSGENE